MCDERKEKSDGEINGETKERRKRQFFFEKIISKNTFVSKKNHQTRKRHM